MLTSVASARLRRLAVNVKTPQANSKGLSPVPQINAYLHRQVCSVPPWVVSGALQNLQARGSARTAMIGVLCLRMNLVLTARRAAVTRFARRRFMITLNLHGDIAIPKLKCRAAMLVFLVAVTMDQQRTLALSMTKASVCTLMSILL